MKKASTEAYKTSRNNVYLIIQTRDPERAMGESTSSGDEVEAHEMSLFGPPPASQKVKLLFRN